MPQRILVALGGNAIKQADERGTAEEQIENCKRTCLALAEIVSRMKKDDRLVITHGNGPQAGNLMLQQEETAHIVPPQPLDVVIAMTQGQIGYMLQQTLINCLRKKGISKPVCTILSEVLVKTHSEVHPEKTLKPVGDLLTKEEAVRMKKDHPEYVFRKVYSGRKRSWRRVLDSPEPMAIVESEIIKKMVDCEAIVITSGGGGVPVIIDDQNNYVGVEAIVDKDLAGAKLAELVGADVFLILTDVEQVKINFGLCNERNLNQLSVSEAKNYMEQGHFAEGSMEPKVKACIRFLESGGRKAVITSLDKVVQALDGKAGTHIYTD